MESSANNGPFQQYYMQNDAVRENIASNIAVLQQYAPEDNDEYSTLHYTKNTVITGHRQYSRQVNSIGTERSLLTLQQQVVQ